MLFTMIDGSHICINPKFFLCAIEREYTSSQNKKIAEFMKERKKYTEIHLRYSDNTYHVIESSHAIKRLFDNVI